MIFYSKHAESSHLNEVLARFRPQLLHILFVVCVEWGVSFHPDMLTGNIHLDVYVHSWFPVLSATLLTQTENHIS